MLTLEDIYKEDPTQKIIDEGAGLGAQQMLKEGLPIFYRDEAYPETMKGDHFVKEYPNGAKFIVRKILTEDHRLLEEKIRLINKNGMSKFEGGVNFTNVFADAFETFKVFKNLTIEQSSAIFPNVPKTVWQILNHLITWQQYNIALLNESTDVKEVAESETWSVSPIVENQNLLNDTILIFESQINTIKNLVECLNLSTHELESKLKIIQEVVTHLSFHIGEIILIRRQMGNYPMPHEMNAFLNTH